MYKILILLLLIINSTAFARNLKSHYCKTSHKLSLLYLNGVANSESDANNSKEHIEGIISKKGPLENVANSEICSGILYNQTYGIGNSDYTDNACNLDNLKSVDFSKCYLPLFDFVETIGQKVREARSAEGLSFVWSDMVSFINEGKTDDLLRGMSNTAKTALQTFLFKRIEAKIIFSVSAIYENETLDKIYLESKKFIQIPMADNQVEYRPTVVVSHSQGNLFYNRLHDKLKAEGNIPAKYFEEKFANLQVGSTAIKSNASIAAYHTAGNDKVIHTALGTVFAVREPDIWVIKPSADDGANHSFIDTYSNNKVLITDKESVFDEYEQTGNYDAAQLENTEDVFYEKLNRLASIVLFNGYLSLRRSTIVKRFNNSVNLKVQIPQVFTSFKVITAKQNFKTGEFFAEKEALSIKDVNELGEDKFSEISSVFYELDLLIKDMELDNSFVKYELCFYEKCHETSYFNYSRINILRIRDTTVWAERGLSDIVAVGSGSFSFTEYGENGAVRKSCNSSERTMTGGFGVNYSLPGASNARSYGGDDMFIYHFPCDNSMCIFNGCIGNGANMNYQIVFHVKDDPVYADDVPLYVNTFTYSYSD